MNTITFITALLAVSLVLSYDNGDYGDHKHGDYGDHKHGDYGDHKHGDYDDHKHGDYDDHKHGDYDDNKHGDYDHKQGDYDDHKHGDYNDYKQGDYNDHKQGDYDDHQKYGAPEYNFNCEQYTKVYKALDSFISNKNFSAFAIQGIVRLSFHDCVGKSCDGCLNPSDNNNKGLEFRSTLDTIYDKQFKDVLSRADYYALAGHVALIRGVYNTKCKHGNCPSLFLDYRWGRKDCPTSPKTATIDGFPDSHGAFPEVLRIMKGMFNLEFQEIVALMGGHSLGGSHVQFSGFNFNWQNNITVFNNAYFINMLAEGYTHQNVGNKTYASRRYEFVRPHVEKTSLLMLNVDMSLLKNIVAEKDKTGAYTGHVHCGTQKGVMEMQEGAVNQFLECEQAPTASVVVAYANDLQLFYNDFSTAWFKMVSAGYPLSGQYALKSPNYEDQVCSSCVPKGSFCASGYSKSGACCKGLSCKNNVCH